MTSFPNKSQENQPTTRLTHDQFEDHSLQNNSPEGPLTTKRPLLRVSNQVVKEQRQRHRKGDAVAGREYARQPAGCQPAKASFLEIQTVGSCSAQSPQISDDVPLIVES